MADDGPSSSHKMASMNLDPRCRILVEYAKWTALSAVRQGPIRAREPVYQLLDGVAVFESAQPVAGTDLMQGIR